MQKICIVGAPGVGKTVLATDVNNWLKLKGYNSEVCLEYAREYKRRFKTVDNVWEQLYLMEQQKIKEIEVAKNHDIVICDSSIFLCYIYSALLTDINNEKERNILTFCYQQATAAIAGYNKVYYIPFIPMALTKDNVRDETIELKYLIDLGIKSFMDLLKINYKTIVGNSENRLNLIGMEIVSNLL